jgi:hypothetical protein
LFFKGNQPQFQTGYIAPVEEKMLKFTFMLILGFAGLIVSPGLVTEASAQQVYCCRDPWIRYQVGLSRRPCPGYEAPGQCRQYYCFHHDIQLGWKQKPGVFNCDAPGYNYQISEEDYLELLRQGRVK